MRYSQEIKDKAVEMVLQGCSFKEIQETLGPNPKAVQRYLIKAGHDYKNIREQLKEAGQLKPKNNTQKPKNNTQKPKKK